MKHIAEFLAKNHYIGLKKGDIYEGFSFRRKKAFSKVDTKKPG